MKIITIPETRQVFNFDCGSNGLASTLVYAGVEERGIGSLCLARPTQNGTGTTGVLRVYRYYGLPLKAGEHMRACHLRAGIDQGWPTILTLQAYRESNRPYGELWQDGTGSSPLATTTIGSSSRTHRATTGHGWPTTSCTIAGTTSTRQPHRLLGLHAPGQRAIPA